MCALHESPAAQPEIASAHGTLCFLPRPWRQHPEAASLHGPQPREVDFPSPDCVHVPSPPTPGAAIFQGHTHPWGTSRVHVGSVCCWSATGDRVNLRRTGREAEFPPVQGLARGPRAKQTTAGILESLTFLVCKKGFWRGLCQERLGI